MMMIFENIRLFQSEKVHTSTGMTIIHIAIQNSDSFWKLNSLCPSKCHFYSFAFNISTIELCIFVWINEIPQSSWGFPVGLSEDLQLGIAYLDMYKKPRSSPRYYRLWNHKYQEPVDNYRLKNLKLHFTPSFPPYTSHSLWYHDHVNLHRKSGALTIWTKLRHNFEDQGLDKHCSAACAVSFPCRVPVQSRQFFLSSFLLMYQWLMHQWLNSWQQGRSGWKSQIVVSV